MIESTECQLAILTEQTIFVYAGDFFSDRFFPGNPFFANHAVYIPGAELHDATHVLFFIHAKFSQVLAVHSPQSLHIQREQQSLHVLVGCAALMAPEPAQRLIEEEAVAAANDPEPVLEISQVVE